MTQQITPSRRKELAERLGLNEQYLYQCLTGRRDMDHAQARRAEAETDGELSRKMLCQQSFAQVWPELAEAETTPPAPEPEKAGA